jgi:hypothetical protein
MLLSARGGADDYLAKPFTTRIWPDCESFREGSAAEGISE